MKDLDDWQRRLGVASQVVLLINGTIPDHIASATPDADDIIKAARAADAEFFILCLPDHYATRVGERGFRLSGGGSVNASPWLDLPCRSDSCSRSRPRCRAGTPQ